jgi:hypothetical protein
MYIENTLADIRARPVSFAVGLRLRHQKAVEVGWWTSFDEERGKNQSWGTFSAAFKIDAAMIA